MRSTGSSRASGCLATLTISLQRAARRASKRSMRLAALSASWAPPASEVLAVGDALQTDALGAARMGFDFVFVQGGIHAGEPFPEDFAALNGLDDWHPVAVVDGLS